MNWWSHVWFKFVKWFFCLILHGNRIVPLKFSLQFVIQIQVYGANEIDASDANFHIKFGIVELPVHVVTGYFSHLYLVCI